MLLTWYFFAPKMILRAHTEICSDSWGPMHEIPLTLSTDPRFLALLQTLKPHARTGGKNV